MRNADRKTRPAAARFPRGLRTGFRVLAFACALAGGPALAERTDRDKPVNIESDRMNADDAKKTAVFDGRVVMTQGTLIIKADRLTIRQDNQGFQYGIALGSPATFRQKRDGANEYIDGEAERIEYDGRLERIQLFERARLRRDTGDDVRGNYISYDARSEYFTVQSSKDAQQQGRDSRVRVVIMPKKKDGEVEESPQSKPAPPPQGMRPQ
jgi:lipopolysaccharide export system protein LptA